MGDEEVGPASGDDCVSRLLAVKEYIDVSTLAAVGGGNDDVVDNLLAIGD
jgi:hypothetical protein